MSARPRVSLELCLAVLASGLAVAPSAAVAKRSVPRGWVGVVAPTELTNRASLVPGQTRLMARAGAESERATFYWRVAQPYATKADVPADARSSFVEEGGIPTDWDTFDRIVTAAARNHLRLLPTVLSAPVWASDDPTDIPILTPRDPQDFARFMTTLVKRYGPAGTFWTEHPSLHRMPIRAWQIWNEPHLLYYWRQYPGKPWYRTYTKLLKDASQAIHHADAGAKVVLGGLTYFSWRLLPKLYAAGAGRWFDIAAIHPYSLELANVIKILRLDRAAMRRGGDARKPMWLTETSWPSAKGRTRITYGYNVTRRVQARNLTRAFRRYAALRRSLRIGRVFWYKWLSYDSGTSDPFDYAGLRALSDGKVKSKPAYFAFRKVALSLDGR